MWVTWTERRNPCVPLHPLSAPTQWMPVTPKASGAHFMVEVSNGLGPQDHLQRSRVQAVASLTVEPMQPVSARGGDTC